MYVCIYITLLIKFTIRENRCIILITSVPGTDPECSHQSILHAIHENKGIGFSHSKENKRKNDEGVD